MPCASEARLIGERSEGCAFQLKVAIVIPTIRYSNICTFLKAWECEFANQIVIVIEDNPERTFELSLPQIWHYSWKEIDDELGADSWIIPRRTDCVRSFGFFKAYQQGVDLIVSLDDDCLPSEPGFIAKHCEMLDSEPASDAWVSTVDGAAPRGFPYFATRRALPCVLNHGLWQKVPDYDAITQLQTARRTLSISPVERAIPRGAYFPMCGMNIAFKTQLTPAMYFLLMGRDWPYDRFGDIWCGVFVKRICDHLGYGVTSGQPFVRHERASDVWENLRKEASAYEANETLWQVVDRAILSGDNVADCYGELAQKLTIPGPYWTRLRTAMRTWADLFLKGNSRAQP